MLAQVLEFFPNAGFSLQREWNPEGCERKLCLFLDRGYILKYYSPSDSDMDNDTFFKTTEDLNQKYLNDGVTTRFFIMWGKTNEGVQILINGFFTLDFKMKNRSCSRRYMVLGKDLIKLFLTEGEVTGDDIIKEWGDPVEIWSPYGKKYRDEVPAAEIISISMSPYQQEQLKQWAHEGQNRN